MSIDPLQSTILSNSFRQTAPGKARGDAPFDKVLDTVTALGKLPKEAAATEILRMELMRSSLALGGDAPAEQSFQSPALASILSGLATYKKAALPADAAPAPAPAAGATGATADPPAESAGTGEITRTAARFLGTPYRFGGEGPAGIDCSSFVQQVFREHQIALPRTAREQIAMGTDVPKGELKEGDLVFFQTYASYPSHVGIYLGNGKMIHASSHAGEVTVSDMNSDYFRARFIGAKRVA